MSTTGIAEPRADPSPTPTDVQACTREGVTRAVTGIVTGAPVVFLIVAMWQAWNANLHWYDLVVFAITYIAIGLGVTIGFHRLLTHRSFKTSPFLRGVLAALGSAAIEGPVIAWVADHRKHHAFSDRRGDPHSPHLDHGQGWRGALRGLAHAHVGWLFLHNQRAAKERYAPDLLADPVIRFVNAMSPLWVLLGLAVPFGLGVAIGGSIGAGLTGLLWGAPSASSSCTTSPTASTRYATSTGASRSRPTTTRATSPGCRWRRSAKPGTTTTMPFPPPRSTDCAASNWTPPRS